MCIGPPMSGKTTAIKILTQSLQHLHRDEYKEMALLFQRKKAAAQDINITVEDGVVKPVIADPVLDTKIQIKPEEVQLIIDICTYKGVDNFVISPKAVTIFELMGRFDETSREWVDGLLSHAIRHASAERSGKQMFVTFDGPVEPDWVENMNSVLDDNKRLKRILNPSD